jgi:predicted DNA-binding protein (MmcQ/YjbR family)
MTRKDPVLEKLRAICLALPDTTETPTWGKPHFRVKEKIFCGYDGEDADGASLGFKMEKEVAFAIVSDPRFFRAPYVGQHGWVGMRTKSIKAKDWSQVREMIIESYRLIAPKASLAKLDSAKPASAKPAKAKTAKTKPKSSTARPHAR